jgi:hypothetical protein
MMLGNYGFERVVGMPRNASIASGIGYYATLDRVLFGYIK